MRHREDHLELETAERLLARSTVEDAVSGGRAESVVHKLFHAGGCSSDAQQRATVVGRW